MRLSAAGGAGSLIAARPVEFLEYAQTVRELGAMGIASRQEGDLMRFEVRSKPQVAPEVRRLVIGPADELGDTPEDTRRFEVDRVRIPGMAERLLHKIHITEAVLLPVGTWGAVVNAVVFDLATDESWLEIDAEASLHQNGRDPLLVSARDMHILRAMIEALMKNGEGRNQDLAIAAVGAPLLIEVRHEGVLHIWCGSPAIADELAKAVA